MIFASVSILLFSINTCYDLYEVLSDVSYIIHNMYTQSMQFEYYKLLNVL